MQRYTVYLYLETALHVSGGTSTHHQERIKLYLQHLVFVTPLLLSAAIVEELELVRVCCGWRMLYEHHEYKKSLLVFHAFSAVSYMFQVLVKMGLTRSTIRI
jgi:DNA-directed RNA polymerase subunit N (RpoN/RPB10)